MGERPTLKIEKVKDLIRKQTSANPVKSIWKINGKRNVFSGLYELDVRSEFKTDEGKKQKERNIIPIPNFVNENAFQDWFNKHVEKVMR